MSKKLKISGPVGGAGIVISTVDAYQPQPPDHAKPTRQSATSSQGEAIHAETSGVKRYSPPTHRAVPTSPKLAKVKP